MTKLERIRNYFVRTNTSDNTTVEYPANEARYRLSEDSYYLTSINDASIGQYYKFAELLDGSGNAWADIATLTDWLRQNTGGNEPIDYFLEVSRGDIDGVSHINKFGANVNITKNTEEDVWDGGGTYVFPTTADITHIHQDADQATLRGGTIELQGLDANWDAIVQNVNLNATNTTTPVAIDTPMIRIFRMKVLENVVATSDIHADNVGDTIHYAIMTAPHNQTLMAIYTVPRGKTAYLTNYYCTVVESTGKEPKSTRFKLWAADRANGYAFQLKHAIGIPKAGSMVEHSFSPYGSVGEKTDIKISAYADSEAGDVASGFDLILVDNA